MKTLPENPKKCPEDGRHRDTVEQNRWNDPINPGVYKIRRKCETCGRELVNVWDRSGVILEYDE
jgi:hypothetical protein